MYLLEFAGGFVIQVSKFHANPQNKFIRAYLSNYFNALIYTFKKKFKESKSLFEHPTNLSTYF